MKSDQIRLHQIRLDKILNQFRLDQFKYYIQLDQIRFNSIKY